jgi:hypothetical protein
MPVDIPILAPGGAISCERGQPSHGSLELTMAGDSVEFMCLQAVVIERLLHETLASVGQDILRLIWVNLKKERKVSLCASGFFRVPSLTPSYLCFFSTCPEVAQTCLCCGWR